MANSLSGVVWVLDTAGTTLLFNGRWKCKKIYWFNPTTIAHTMQLTDAKDQVIIDGRAEAANGSQQWDFDSGKWFNGLKLPTLASGKVEIYIG